MVLFSTVPAYIKQRCPGNAIIASIKSVRKKNCACIVVGSGSEIENHKYVQGMAMYHQFPAKMSRSYWKLILNQSKILGISLKILSNFSFISQVCCHVTPTEWFVLNILIFKIFWRDHLSSHVWIESSEKNPSTLYYCPDWLQVHFISEQILLRHIVQFFVHMTASSTLQW